MPVSFLNAHFRFTKTLNNLFYVVNYAKFSLPSPSVLCNLPEMSRKGILANRIEEGASEEKKKWKRLIVKEVFLWQT